MLIIFMFLLFINCQKPKSEIHYISLYTTTITLVKCENLKKSSTTKSIVLSDEENDELVNIFSHLKPLKKNLGIDARVYGSVYDGSKKISFCSSVGVIEINNKKYLVDDKLREYLLMLTSKK